MTEETQEQEQPSEFDYTALAKRWIQDFEKVVRRKVLNFDQLRQMFHTKLVWFGLETNICASLQQAIDEEFSELWPKQVGFTCDMSRAVVFPDRSAVFILVPWISKSKIAGAPAKNGRATFAIAMFDENKLLCLHGHMSVNSVARITKS